LSVTVASGERLLSKLKLIKNYLRSIISQERTNLATVSIEHEIASKFKTSKLIKQFAEVKDILYKTLYQFYFSSISATFMEVFRFYNYCKLLC